MDGKGRKNLEFGSTIFEQNTIVIVSNQLTVIVVDFLEKSSYWINGIAFNPAIMRDPRTTSPSRSPLLRRVYIVYRALIKHIKLDKYGHG